MPEKQGLQSDVSKIFKHLMMCSSVQLVPFQNQSHICDGWIGRRHSNVGADDEIDDISDDVNDDDDVSADDDYRYEQCSMWV